MTTHPAAQSWIRLRDALAAATGLPTRLAGPLESAEAEAFAEATGYPLHPDLRAVYEVNNGVDMSSWRQAMFLFGGHFLPCRDAAQEQANFQEVAAGIDWDNDPAADPRVRYDYPAPQLTPFWVDGNGNSVAIDNEAGPEGNSGQICVFGADLDNAVEVIFPSLAAMFDFLHGEVQAGRFALTVPDENMSHSYPQLIESEATRAIVNVIGGTTEKLEKEREARQLAQWATKWALRAQYEGLTEAEAEHAVQQHLQKLRGTLERDQLTRTNLSGLAENSQPEQALQRMEAALLEAVARHYSETSGEPNEWSSSFFL